MAEVRPFKAFRPAPDKVSHVVSRSHEYYSRKARERLMASNPLSFLHIINPGYKTGKDLKRALRFREVRRRFEEFLSRKIYLQDPNPGFYLYQITKSGFSCCGLLCATSSEAYDKGLIKKHENTLEKREKLFADYLQEVQFNAEPVLMTHSASEAISAIYGEILQTDPVYTFNTPDGAAHQLWHITGKSEQEAISKAFAKIPALYIADGHHRTASSYRLTKRLRALNPQHTGEEPYNFFMSYLIPDSEVKIYEFNRMVKELNGLSSAEFLEALQRDFHITDYGESLFKPTRKHEFSMYLDGKFYSLQLRPEASNFKDPLSKLDTQILFQSILKPILGIDDLRNDKRIAYGYGKHNMKRMQELIDEKLFTVGFSLLPITMDEIKTIADAGLVMPPKSTYIEPKLYSGLTIYEL